MEKMKAALTIDSMESTPDSAVSPPGTFRETQYGWLVLAVVWLASAVYLGVHLRVGWVPADPGMLAQMASRVLRGQVPHRDFVEVYTGGLTYLNALALRLFGMNFFSMRIPLFLFFLAWVPSAYWIARRFAGPLGAGAVTVLGVAWSLPNYPEAMPSWYNLFFATWGVLALFRYSEMERRRWLWMAGLCCGFSFLFKISGIYFVAACLLFFVYREQLQDREDVESSKLRGLGYRLFVTAGMLVFLAILTNLVAARPSAEELVHFVFPAACLVAFLLAKAWREPSSPSVGRLGKLFSMGWPFGCGMLIPVAVFLGWFFHENALGAWFHGTFVLAGVHLLWGARNGMPILATTVGLAPAILVLLLAGDSAASTRRLARFGAPVVLAGLLVAAWRSAALYSLIGFSVPLLVVALAVATPFCLWANERGDRARREQVFLIVTAAVTWALVQFPESMPLYFCYVAPLVALALFGLVSTRRQYDRVAAGSLIVFYLAFAVWLHTPGYFQMMRKKPLHSVSLRPLSLPRSGHLLVKAKEAAEYERLIGLVRSHARSRYIYAGPDSPEVYFLSGEWNPTGTIWDFLDRDFLDVPARTQRILESIDRHRVNLVVIKEGQIDSGPLPGSLVFALDKQFPRSAHVGHFEVRWKP